MQRKRLAGQDFCLSLNVILRIHHVVEGVPALEGKNIGIFPVDFDARGGDVNRLHAESGDADDGNDGEHEGQNQPLVLPQDEQIIVKVRLSGREIEGGKTVGERHELHVTVRAFFVWNEFVFVSHDSSDTQGGREPPRCPLQHQFRRPCKVLVSNRFPARTGCHLAEAVRLLPYG